MRESAVMISSTMPSAIRVAGHVGERQHRDRWLVWQGEGRLGRRFGTDHHAKDAHRPRDVLQRLLADVLEGEVEPARGILAHPRGDADPARLGQAFEPGRDIDPVAKDVAVLDDDVALVNADAEVDPAVGRQRAIALGHRRLQLSRTTGRIDDAGKFDQQAVAGGLDDAAMMALDLRVDHLGAQYPEPAERALLIGLDQPRVAGDIGRQDRGKPAGRGQGCLIFPIGRSSAAPPAEEQPR